MWLQNILLSVILQGETFIHSFFMHSFTEHLSSSYKVQSTVPGSGMQWWRTLKPLRKEERAGQVHLIFS